MLDKDRLTTKRSARETTSTKLNIDLTRWRNVRTITDRRIYNRREITDALNFEQRTTTITTTRSEAIC